MIKAQSRRRERVRVDEAGRKWRPFQIQVAVALLVAAVRPAIVGGALLVSAALRRPLLARVLAPVDVASSSLLTLVWGGALIAIAAVQVAGAATGFGSITSPTGLAIRTALALGLETILLALTAAYLRRTTASTGRGRV